MYIVYRTEQLRDAAHMHWEDTREVGQEILTDTALRDANLKWMETWQLLVSICTRRRGSLMHAWGGEDEEHGQLGNDVRRHRDHSVAYVHGVT